MVEQGTENPCVGGSSPSLGTILIFLNALDVNDFFINCLYNTEITLYIIYVWFYALSKSPYY